jgi:general secretion pathway protein G
VEANAMALFSSTMRHMMKKSLGFTLIEVLLVVVIISMIMMMTMGYIQQKTQAMRNDRVSAQMQQVLSAGLSYYVARGKWPDSMNDLQSGSSPYLPPTFKSPWGMNYFVAHTIPLFYVYTPIRSASSTSGTALANATVIAGTLPLGYTSSDTTTSGIPDPNHKCPSNSNSCTVAASVNIPGQNLNNATAVNYAGLYHNGACVPAPQCPVDMNGKTMTPQIFVVPVQVNGVNDKDQIENVYPISSFAAFAKGPASTPPGCSNTGINAGIGVNCDFTGGTPLPSGGQYWRVCISAATEKGTVRPTTPDWGKAEGIVMAITRCAVTDEPTGSGFDVWQQ